MLKQHCKISHKSAVVVDNFLGKEAEIKALSIHLREDAKGVRMPLFPGSESLGTPLIPGVQPRNLRHRPCAVVQQAGNRRDLWKELHK